jgi:hypothetical protein
MMPVVGYARVSSFGQDLAVQLEKLEGPDARRSSGKNGQELMLGALS